MKPFLYLLLLTLAPLSLAAASDAARRQCERWADEDEVPAGSRSAYIADCVVSLDDGAPDETVDDSDPPTPIEDPDYYEPQSD